MAAEESATNVKNMGTKSPEKSCCQSINKMRPPYQTQTLTYLFKKRYNYLILSKGYDTISQTTLIYIDNSSGKSAILLSACKNC